MSERVPAQESRLETLRKEVTEHRGRHYWSRLSELAAMPEFAEQSGGAHPAFAAAATDFDRRRFLQLAAASMALLGVAACGPEVEPRNRQSYVEQPPGMVAGRARYYATATSLEGYGSGVLIEHQMGRPIKVEGNPDHPASLGATSVIGQASILSLYDPYRAQALTHQGAIATWEGLATAVLERRPELLARKGENLALLTGAMTSPTLVAQITALRASYPALRQFQWVAVDRDAARAGAEMAFGRPVDAVPTFAAADVVVAVGSDFLDSAPGHLRFARDFASRRRAAEMRERMSRLYALESTPTLAGAKADHRLILPPSEIERALRRLAGKLGAGPAGWANLDHPHARALDAIAAELRRAQGQALVHVGSAEQPIVHALAHAVNQAIGSFGRTVRFIEPVAFVPESPAASLAALTDAMSRGEIDTLVIIGAANPAFSAPADLEFTRALARVPLSIYLGQYADETAATVMWHVPEAHEYEAWSDVRAFDGTATILQPQIRTQADRRSAHELLALLAGEDRPDGYAVVRSHWQASAKAVGVGGFDSFWTEALRVGVVPQTAAQAVNVMVRPDFAQSLAPPASTETGITVLFRPDPFLWDGRFADNGWLQELGRPFTRLTWDNAALVSPRTAQQSGLVSGDVVAIELGGRRIRAPVWVLPGQADGCVTLPLGFGRRVCGPVGEGAGFDAYPLRTQESLWHATGVSIRGMGERHAFATVQGEAPADGRDLIHEGTLAQFLKDPEFLRGESPAQSLYAAFQYEGIAWAMSINLNACIGCQACVAACQAENNSPVVGKTEVLRGREMHWLRIDRYYSGSADDPATLFQPVPCMQCEDAPCEVVCPVHATVHDSEGLNVMVYNRCVGTRFCSNNCPYKVRRFNFFDYTRSDPRPRESWNPEVTVRARGVMEKCTYCIQRTRAAMIDADRENRRVRDGEVITACQQVCPTRAITFGDRNDPQSAVAKRKASPLDYVMLASLNTRPRTSYEALIRNPNPGLGDG
ncbi:MAG: 4Fe-4S dicluster domain-containing protein [Steroidobacteraceae bacterium]